MDKQLEDLQAEMGKYVEIKVNERPLTNLFDAITVGKRAGVIFRFAENGPNFEIRWTLPDTEGGGAVFLVPPNQLPVVIADKIIERNKPADKPPIIVPELPLHTDAALELAASHDIELGEIRGTGAHGKIVISDVREYIDAIGVE